MSAFSAAEARWLAEPEDRCGRCGDPIIDGWLCGPCEDDEADAAALRAEDRDRLASPDWDDAA